MPQPSFDWQHKFKHAGESVYVTGKKLSASGESAIRGAVRTEDYGRAEIALLANTIKTVKVNERLEFDTERKSKKNQDIPSKYDPKTAKTTAELILEHIVTVVAPHLADQFEDCFSVYYKGETSEPLEEENLDENPTGRSSGALIEFPDEEAM